MKKNLYHTIFLVLAGFIITVSATASVVFPFANNRLIKYQDATLQKLVMSEISQDAELGAIHGKFKIVTENQAKIMAELQALKIYMMQHDKLDEEHARQDAENFKKLGGAK